MKLKIKKIILFPTNDNLKIRVINFEASMINIISGYSQRGKSALIPIIDYCLGSSECNIPIGKIREMVDKFAIEIELEDMNALIARDNPSKYNFTNMYLYVDHKENLNLQNFRENIETYKSNRGLVKNYLGKLAGFENVADKDEATVSGFDAPASFRDATAFQFQPQNIIANPTTIFYNTDTFEHLRRLKTLFPLVLGYKSFEILELEKNIGLYEKEIDVLQKKFDDISTQYENWQKDIYEYYTKAINLGLTNADIDINNSKVEEIKNILREIIKDVKNNRFFKPDSSIRFNEKIEELDKQRIILMRELEMLKTELSKIEQFDRSKNIYLNDVVKEVNNRLNPINWFLEQNGTNICPFCDSESNKAIDELLSLKNDKENAEGIIRRSQTILFSFEKEKREITSKKKELEGKIINLDENIDLLIAENGEYYMKYQGIYEFIGKLENILENIAKISPTGELFILIDQKRIELSNLRNRLRVIKEGFNKDNALNKLTEIIKSYIVLLPIEERVYKNVKLDPDSSVNIKIEDTKSKEINFLSKIGSGANHMNFHLATILGLHEYFLKLSEAGKTNYIPSFIVLDQPSQVYFPENYDIEVKPDSKIKIARSEDVKNTSMIFEACSTFVERTNFECQVIILEHAPKETWEGINHINFVEEWRGGPSIDDINYNALLQSDWLLADVSD